MKTDLVVVLGAGLTGLSAAMHLSQKDKILVLEKEETPGGLCRSVTKDGFTFDYTGHLLHLKTDYGKRLITDLMGDSLVEFSRRARIFSKGVWTAYPFQANTYGLPESVCRECVDGIRTVQDHPIDRSNLLRWIQTTFGAGIADHFMIPYNQKLWCTPLDQLSCDWVGDYIPRPTVEEVEDGARAPRGERNFGYNASFFYPREGGIQALSDALARRVEDLRCESEIVAVNTTQKMVQTRSGETFNYDRLITTLPLKRFVSLIKDAPSEVKEAADRLKAVSVYNMNLGVKKNRTDAHWSYYPEAEFPFYRIGFYHNFGPSMAPPETSSYYVEMAFDQDKTPDITSLRHAALEAMKKPDLIDDESDILAEFSTVIDTGYVLYTHDRAENIECITRWLESNKIISTGRYGGWEYSAMEEAILEGRSAAERILKNE